MNFRREMNLEFQCKFCSSTLPTWNSLDRHIRQLHKDQYVQYRVTMTDDLPVRCDKCQFCFPSTKFSTSHFGTRRCSEALKMFLEHDAVDADDDDCPMPTKFKKKKKKEEIKIKKEFDEDGITEVIQEYIEIPFLSDNNFTFFHQFSGVKFQIQFHFEVWVISNFGSYLISI